MKKIFFGLSLLFAVGLIFGIQAKQFQALAEVCNNPAERWNIDYTANNNTTVLSPLFSCGCATVGGETKDDPTRSNDHGFCVNKCSPACSNGQKCFCQRKQDCADIGGICFRGNVTKANVDQQKYPDGKTRDQLNAERGPGDTNDYTQYVRQIKYRCPSEASITCYVDVPKPLPPVKATSTAPVVVTPIKATSTASVVVTPKAQATPATNATQVALTPSDCCTQIVPDIGDPTKFNYSLNHVVQVAINVYECILCIVGALILLMLVAGAFILLTSAGNDSRVGLAKQIISGAIIGGLIVFFSYLIINFTVKALGGKFKDESRVEISV